MTNTTITDDIPVKNRDTLLEKRAMKNEESIIRMFERNDKKWDDLRLEGLAAAAEHRKEIAEHRKEIAEHRKETTNIVTKLSEKIDSNFRWLLGAMVTMATLIIAAAKYLP